MKGLETLAFLRSAAGEVLLSRAAEVMQESASELRALTRLRRDYPSDHVAAAIETIDLRKRAARKFSFASRMFFTRDALEQATGEAVSAHCAARFAGFERMADLGCGIGGDTIALARISRVVAIDRDPLRLAIARVNAEVYGVAERTDFLLGDIRSVPLANVEAAFCDPGRRSDGRRIFDPRHYEPPLGAVTALAGSMPALAIKVSPGIRDEALPSGCEVEFIQERGDLKQAVLWLGPLATTRRRATLLPGGQTLTTVSVAHVPAAPPRQFLFEPGPAVIRAHAIEQVAHSLGATKIDDSTAFLCADVSQQTPFATAYRVEEWMPFNLKQLRRRLRALDIGHVVVKTRASPLDPQELGRSLRLEGSGERILVLTRVLGRHSVLICRVDRDQTDT